MQAVRDLERLEEVATIGGTLIWAGRRPWPHPVISLRPEHFGSSRHRKIWEAVSDMLAAREPIDEVSVSAKLKSYGAGEYLFPYLSELADECPTAENLEHWAGLVLRQGRRRVLSAEMRRAAVEAKSCDTETAAALFRAAVEKAEQEAPSYKGLDPVGTRLVAEMHKLEDEAEHADEYVIQTGIKALDRKCKLRRGQLTILAGRPSMGKTALAGTIISNCARRVDTHVAMFSLEMSTSEVIRRLVSMTAEQPTDNLPQLAAQGALTTVLNDVHRMNLLIDERTSLSTGDIRQEITRCGHGVTLIVADYLQLIRLDADEERHDLRVGAVAKDMKAIAKEFNCHVILLSQLNRSVEQTADKRPSIGHLRDSGNLEEHADHIWLLYRPGYYRKDVERTDAEVIVGKQRNGSTGPVHLRFVPEYAKWMD